MSSLLAKLKRAFSMVDKLDALQGSLDLVAARQMALEARLKAGEFQLVTEVDRLDLFLNYHVQNLSGQMTALSGHLAATAGRVTPRIFALHDGRYLIKDDYALVIPGNQLGLLTFFISHWHADIEPGVQRAIREILKPGDLAVDVGANFGLHAVVMATGVGASGQVVCFEPQAGMARSLVESMALNGFQARTTIRPLGVSDRAGEHAFHESPHSPMSSFFPLAESDRAQTSMVQVTTLDDYFPAGTKIALVKIDAEGAEPLIYDGMRRVISDNPGLSIILEWSKIHFTRAGKDPGAFARQLRADGFVARLILDSGEDAALPLDDHQIEGLENANLLLSRT